MGEQGLIFALGSFLARAIAGAYALPTVKRLVKGWVLLYSAAAPVPARDQRRADIEADLHDEIEDLQAERYRPEEIALRVFVRMAIGMPSDMVWTASYLPQSVAWQLEQRSRALRRSKTPALALISTGLLVMMNLGVLASEPDVLWEEFLVVNIGTVSAIVLIACQKQTWARRVMTCLPGVLIAMAIGLLIWMMIEYRWYEEPMFPRFILMLGSAMLPVIAASAVGTTPFRVRIFGGRWWPVYVSWLLIAVISIATAAILKSYILLIAWSSVFIGLGGIIIMSLIFCGGAVLIGVGGTKGTAACMDLAAKGIRRFTD